MSWMHDLYATYENNQKEVAQNLDQRAVLLPIAHSTNNAQLEITIDEKGQFVRAREVGKEETITIIPVTEDSGARTSGNAPHPLMDKLEYIAGDYEAFTGKSNTAKHEKYLECLEKWAYSIDGCREVQAIYQYLKQGKIITQLVEKNVLEQDAEENKLTDRKINGIVQADCFVRFNLQPSTVEELGETTEIYKNPKVFNHYIDYCINQQQDLDLCYVTGKRRACLTKHPAKIRHAGDKAKLISGNDTSGFTYRGRLEDANQVASIGYEVSQKAHSVLRWLIAKQGFAIEELTIVAWEVLGKKIISPTSNTQDGLFEEEDELLTVVTTNAAYAKKIEHAAKGYRQSLDTQTEVVVLGVEAATTGRLSVSFYRKMDGSQFMENIMHWYKTCFWYYPQMHKKSDKSIYAVGTPSPKEIAKVAYGDKNDKLLKATIERLMPCIIDKKKIPRDIVKAALNKVASPMSYDSKGGYLKQVAITCALIRKSRYDYQKEEWEMALDRSNTDRSYVYGRLLAAAQKVEEVALYYAGEGNRATAAERLTQQFVRRPAKTWKIINDYLRPYTIRLKATGHTWYLKELQEIYDLIEDEAFNKQEPLTELYLLGYNCQLNSYNKNKDESEKGENA